jgi:A/G-specific adenine glycosylase
MPRPAIRRPRRHATVPAGRRLRLLDRLLRSWYGRTRRDLPWRRTRNPYRILVAEIMLQQTTVRAVVPRYRRFLRRFPTLAALAGTSETAVLAAWSGLGYYDRARRLRAAARRIATRHGGRFPRRFDDLLALPGVGRYTAGAVASIAFGERRPILDGNVARVLARLFLVRAPEGGARRRLWDLAGRLVAVTPDPGALNQALMELGATVCAPARPDCASCPVARRCAARRAGVQRLVPPPASRPAPARIRAEVLLVARRGRWLMRRRAGTALLRGLWEFPTVGLDAGRPAGSGGRAAARASGGPRLARGRAIATFRHSITHRRYDIVVRRARLLSEPRGPRYRWVSPGRIAALPASSLIAKVAAACPVPARRRVSGNPARRPPARAAARRFDPPYRLC